MSKRIFNRLDDAGALYRDKQRRGVVRDWLILLLAIVFIAVARYTVIAHDMAHETQTQEVSSYVCQPEQN